MGADSGVENDGDNFIPLFILSPFSLQPSRKQGLQIRKRSSGISSLPYAPSTHALLQTEPVSISKRNDPSERLLQLLPLALARTGNVPNIVHVHGPTGRADSCAPTVFLVPCELIECAR